MRASITVTTTPTRVAAADADRDWMIIDNPSDATVYLDLTGESDAPLTSANGLSLASGTKVSFTGTLSRLQVLAVTATGSKTLVVQGAS